MSALLTTAAIRRVEANALAALPEGTLMSRAALEIARHAESMLVALPHFNRVNIPGAIAVLAGPGNNGCDALLAALTLRNRGHIVRVYSATAHRTAAESASGQPLNDRLLALCADIGMPARPLGALADETGTASIAIEGLFGLGQNRPLSGPFREAATALNAAGLPVLAVDIPAGIDANCGVVLCEPANEPSPVAVRATRTLTFIADKPGLHTGEAVDYVGEVILATLGVAGSEITHQVPQANARAAPEPDNQGASGTENQETSETENQASSGTNSPNGSRVVGQPAGEHFGRGHAVRLLPRRARNTHKGSFGSVLIIGGSRGMTGAPWLAALGAQAGGAGKVFIASPSQHIVPPPQAQWMTRALPPLDRAPNENDGTRQHLVAELLRGIDAVALGCGLGRSAASDVLLRLLWSDHRPLVLDADGLNILASVETSNSRPAGTQMVLTPHPLEAARLLGVSTAHIQADRRQAAVAIAVRFASVVLLKGAGSVIADSGGRWAILDAGAPTLATAGSGDVLAGVIAALLAQGLPAWDAARLGAWAHGVAGESAQQMLPLGTGMAAIELFRPLRKALNGR